MSNAAMCIFNAAHPKFDASTVVRLSKELSETGEFWNYIPGLFAFPALNSTKELRETFTDAGLVDFVIVKFDNASIDGSLNEFAWSSFIFGSFEPYKDEILSQYEMSPEKLDLYLAEFERKKNA